MTQNHDDNNTDKSEVNLKSTESLVELTKIVEKNSLIIEKINEKINDENPTISEWSKKLNNWEIVLEKKFEQIFLKIDSLSTKVEENSVQINLLNQQTENNEKRLLNVLEELERLKNLVSTQDQAIEKNSIQINSLDQQIEKHENQLLNILEELERLKNLVSIQDQAIEKIKSELDKKITQTHFETTLNKNIEENNEKHLLLKQTQDEIISEIYGNKEETNNRFNTMIDSIEILNKSLKNLDLRNNAQSTYLGEQRDTIVQLKQGLKEIINQIKEDQKVHFENFSRILESFNENIHTEITLMTQSLKESDINILNEVSNHYMRKKIGKELEEKIGNLTTELKVEAKKTREELVESLENTVGEYEEIMEQQTSKIKDYQQELEKFQDEILAVIDRKVNEKFEVIFSLLSNIAAHAEKLVLFIKTTDIQIPKTLPEIKNNTNSSEIEETK